MPEACVFSLDPSHVGLADNLVAVWNLLTGDNMARSLAASGLGRGDHAENRDMGFQGHQLKGEIRPEFHGIAPALTLEASVEITVSW
jgi:hypothetical protein